jgi:hypothetical protein
VRFVKFLIRHRKAREASILHRLAKGEADIPTIVRASYIGIDPRLAELPVTLCWRIWKILSRVTLLPPTAIPPSAAVTAWSRPWPEALPG